jgi:UDP-N-acetylmuramate dehydrogenase
MTDDRRPFDAVATGTEIQRRLGVKTSRDESLARFTTMRVGGPADLFAVAHNSFELRGLVRFARSRAIPHVVLGRASDVVISDAGIRGLVIQDRAEGLEIREERLIAEAGVPMARAATESQKAGLSGLEFGVAIPGTIGGAVWANAGAHDGSIAAILETAVVLLVDGTEARLDVADLGFGYRDSRFKHAPPGVTEGDPATPREIVLAATFLLTRAPADEIRARLDEIKRWRQAHQPLGLPSAGSVFRNPSEGPSSGALIEAAGLKGLRIGGASVSEKHANFIVNDGHGTATDVRRLAERVRSEVRRRNGIELAFEIAFLGDWSGYEEEDAA